MTCRGGRQAASSADGQRSAARGRVEAALPASLTRMRGSWVASERNKYVTARDDGATFSQRRVVESVAVSPAAL